nr:MAG TPA: hypothetical protein [Caudoviricetes sp.]
MNDEPLDYSDLREVGWHIIANGYWNQELNEICAELKSTLFYCYEETGCFHSLVYFLVYGAIIHPCTLNLHHAYNVMSAEVVQCMMAISEDRVKPGLDPQQEAEAREDIRREFACRLIRLVTYKKGK